MYMHIHIYAYIYICIYIYIYIYIGQLDGDPPGGRDVCRYRSKGGG